MPMFDIGPQDQLFYDYTPPASESSPCFVFFNALTADISLWQNSVCEALVAAGHGVLVYNMRGQTNSAFAAGTVLDQQLIVADATALLAELNPPRPVFVGLSIGGIFAAWAAQQGARCDGLVFINTLRRDGPRLQWINDAVVRLAEVGGSELIRDIMSPLIMNEGWQAENRQNCLAEGGYTPMDQNSGTYNLLSSARSTNWDFPYEDLTMPTLVITGRHDRVFRDPADLEALYARLPNASSLEVPDAGHMVPVEQPAALAEALLAFAEKLSIEQPA